MNNLNLWNKYREVPKEAQKPIKGGRLAGMTDINPMWRYKCLTEEYGACGIGWYTVTVATDIVDGTEAGEKVLFLTLELYVKQADGTWSMPIEGTGGSMLVSKERGGLYVNDEARKMAETDAVSVCCKKLGIGADIYWSKDNTKYNDSKRDNVQAQNELESQMDELAKTKISEAHVKSLCKEMANIGLSTVVLCKEYGKDDVNELTEAEYGDALNKIVVEKKRRGIVYDA